MRESRETTIGFKVSQREKDKLKYLTILLNHRSMSEMVLTAVKEYAQNRVNVNLEELTERRNDNWKK